MAEAAPLELPAPYLQFDDFLEDEAVERLIEFVHAHEGDLSPSGVLPAPGDDPADVRSSRTLFDLEEIWPMFEAQLQGVLPQMRRELGVPWFKLDRVERQLTVHHDGDFFGVHNDNGGPEVENRQVTYVYYFNKEPKQFDGGDLFLYDYVDRDFVLHKGERHVVVEPRHNSIVFFPSWVHHEVRPVRAFADGIDGCRMTVNGWFHCVPFDDVDLSAADADPPTADADPPMD